MSIANYNTSCYNHAEILISLQTAGNLLQSDLNKALQKVKQHSEIFIEDAGRTVHFRFEIDSSSENSKWGFFQPHRRVMGLIVLASCTTAMEVALLHETFQKQKNAFADFIFDARCFIFGIENALSNEQDRGEILQLADVDSWKQSDEDIKGFLTSLFYILESKRLQMIADKSERPPLLTLPFEKNQSNFDSDSRSYRKKCLGRWKKYIGDICLLAGLNYEALHYYNGALDNLTSVNDQVWSGAALESQCVASFMIQYGKSQPTFESKVLDPKNLAGSVLTGSAFVTDINKLCIQTTDDFVEQYKAAVIYYSRSENMGIVELEACIKATKIMALMKRHIQAAEFLQNAVYIALQVSDDERIMKYSVLADLYGQINFSRKSSFYRRVAAMQCVAPHLQQADWKKCFQLLQRTYEGYGLKSVIESATTLPSIYPNWFGWPQVQIRVLQELIFSAGKNGKYKIANQFALYLLIHLHDYLSSVEEKEVCSSILAITRNDYLKKVDDLDLITFNSYNLPKLCSVELEPPEEHLQVSVLNPSFEDKSVFLFTPTSYQTFHTNQKHSKFKWSVNSASCMKLVFYNPLDTQTISVCDIQPIYKKNNDAKIDCGSLKVDIPPGLNITANMILIPRSEGSIIITGYQATVFGVQSSCLFCNVPWLSIKQFELTAVTDLPILKREDSCLSPDIDNKNKMMIMLYSGEIRLLDVPFTNISDLPIEHVEVSVVQLNHVPDLSKEQSQTNTQWLNVSCDSVLKQLPISAKGSFVLPVILKTAANTKISKSDSLVNSSQVLIKYSNATGAKKNYCRNISVHLMASLRPCIIVQNITVLQSNCLNSCIIALKISNVCEDEVIVCSASLNEENIIGNSLIEYENEKLVLGHLKPNQSFTIKVQISMVALKEEIMDVADLDLYIKDTLSTMLFLTWMIKDDTSSRCGNVDIAYSILDESSFQNFFLQPLCWQIFINNDSLKEIKCHINDVVPLKISMKNTSDLSISSIEIQLEIYQDQKNGFQEYNLQDAVICIGCQTQSFDIHPGENVFFQCSLLFLLSGCYIIRLKKLPTNMELSQFKTNWLFMKYKHFSPQTIVTVYDL